MAEGRNSPSAGARDLCDKSVSVESVQQPTDLRASLLWILVESQGCEGKLVAEVAVGEAMQRMFAAHQRREELSIRPS